tara:strand:- start:951 stop:1091 length:141 start_codon:yes stop_codon:yes gene_type:complete
MIKTIHYWIYVLKLRSFYKNTFNKSNKESLELAKKTAQSIINDLYE